MMKKKVVIVISLLSFSCLVNGMELEDLGGKKKEVTNSTSGMHLNLPSAILNGQNLNASNGSTARTPLSRLNGADTLIKARSALVQQRTDRSTQEGSSAVRRKRLDNEVNPDQVRIDIGNINEDPQQLPINEMMLHSTDVKGLEELFEEKMDSLDEDQKWAFLQKMNRKAYNQVYNFAQIHGKSFDDAMLYVELLEQFEVDPVFVVEHIKQANALNKRRAADWEVKHYEDLQKTDQEKYDMFALGVMNELFDKYDGQDKPATVENEHLVVQEKKIKEQDGYLTKSMIIHAIHFVFTVGALAWGTANEILAKSPHGNSTGA